MPRGEQLIDLFCNGFAYAIHLGQLPLLPKLMSSLAQIAQAFRCFAICQDFIDIFSLDLQ